MNTRDGTMILFNEDRVSNLLPNGGTLDYYGKVLPSREANQYFNLLMQNIPWKNDEVVLFGKHIVTKRKVAWSGDSGYLYTQDINPSRYRSEATTYILKVTYIHISYSLRGISL